MPKWVLTLVLLAGLGGLLGGSFLLSDGIKRLKDFSRVAHWSALPGRVVSAQLRKGEGGRPYADIRYQYRVGGMILQGSNVAAERMGAVESLPPAYVKRYPAGSAVTVYADPKDPRQAMLERRDPQRAYVISSIGAALLLVGLTALQVWRRRLRR